jgi:hypothetical protein
MVSPVSSECMRPPVIHVSGLGFPEGPVVLAEGGIALIDLLDQKTGLYRDGATRGRTLWVTFGISGQLAAYDL